MIAQLNMNIIGHKITQAHLWTDSKFVWGSMERRGEDLLDVRLIFLNSKLTRHFESWVKSEVTFFFVFSLRLFMMILG